MTGSRRRTRPTRPIKDGTPDEQAEYWRQIDGIVAQSKPLSPERWGRVKVLFSTGLRKLTRNG